MYDYTFAAPNTTVASSANAAKYDCIFNIINSDDFIPYFPLAEWGFTRYGKTASVSVANICQDEWEEMTGESYMKMNRPTLPLLKLFGTAYERNDCYNINYDDGIIFNLEQFNSYPSNVSQYYVRSGNTIYQSPMFLMMYFAALAAEVKGGADFAFLNVAPYLEETKWYLIEQVSGRDIMLAGTSVINWVKLNEYNQSGEKNNRIAYPHMQDTYIVLASIITSEGEFT